MNIMNEKRRMMQFTLNVHHVAPCSHSWISNAIPRTHELRKEKAMKMNFARHNKAARTRGTSSAMQRAYKHVDKRTGRWLNVINKLQARQAWFLALSSHKSKAAQQRTPRCTHCATARPQHGLNTARAKFSICKLSRDKFAPWVVLIHYVVFSANTPETGTRNTEMKKKSISNAIYINGIQMTTMPWVIQ